MRVELGGQVLHAVSVGGIETCFQLPAFDCCLDIGRCPPGAVGRSRLFLTHAHMDHAAGLPYYVSMRAMQRLEPPKVYCPAGVAPILSEILDRWTLLDSNANRCTLVPSHPGDEIPIGGDAHVQAFRSPHRVETLGYAFYRRRRKLKAHLHGLDGQAIAARARAGEDIHDTVDRCELCFPGDTSIEVLESEPTVRQARLLLLECTFIGDRPQRSWVRQGGHVHLDDIAERAELFENEAILLTHFSRRYSPSEARAAVQARLPAHLAERVHLLLEPQKSSKDGKSKS